MPQISYLRLDGMDTPVSHTVFVCITSLTLNGNATKFGGIKQIYLSRKYNRRIRDHIAIRYKCKAIITEMGQTVNTQ